MPLPTKTSEEKQEIMRYYLNHKHELGVTKSAVAKLYGISPCTLRTWLKKEQSSQARVRLAKIREPLPVSFKSSDITTFTDEEKKSLRNRIENDRIFLARDILGYSYNPTTGEGMLDPVEEIHLEMDELLNRPERFKLGQFPRGTYKTTFMNIVDSIQELLKNFEETIILGSETWALSRRILLEIKARLLTNKVLIALYGNFLPDPNSERWREFCLGRLGGLWNKDFIYINQRNWITKQPSISTTGTDAEINGDHPGIIKLDDPVGPKNITTFEQKQKVIDYVNQAIHLAGPRGRLHLIGTPWAFDDAYQYTIDTWINRTDGDSSRKLFAYRRLGITNPETGESRMPTKYSLKYLEDLKTTTPIFEHNCQMECNPQAEGNTLFNYKGDIQPFHYSIFKPARDDYRVYITVDPGASMHAKKCYTGIVVGIPQPPYNLCIDQAIRSRFKPSEIVDKLMHLIDEPMYRGRVDVIGIEDAGFQRIFNGSVIELLNEKISIGNAEHLRNIWVRGIDPDDNKHRRIYRIEPYVRNHQLLFRLGLNDMLTQIGSYPHISENNIDLLDALEMLLRIVPVDLLHNPFGIIKSKSVERNLDATKYDREADVYDSSDVGVPCY